MPPSQGYDQNRSAIGQDRLAEFLRADIVPDVTSVPGIGPAAASKLADVGITTTYQLVGKFMMLKEQGVDSVEHCDRFWYWLQDTGISSHRSGIVQCIAEKMDSFFPGIYDRADFE
mmetsp:Transcript_47162/g.102895  ORF Transcript_47162/g.102895 Transcript_47162/m.102895 type:complete len:116 (-) Transcript_47162:121-468(-)|eukprot:CAMPEP_0116890428 /NCGR_PEP_ID=MMETSP0467-20121206/973_1 /TAXON_ID=283647 /ORGANISM="Mesodinium pulex, Strain SPMC105" /LENGTH=115 /DNA_ID=CAMNT_0004558191 /DNA_START=54 /DNA_END=401 /DNA_ORIENTATION=+